MTFTKTQLALSITAAALSMAIVAPQAVAAESKADRVADAAARKTEALEAQMQQMADQMQAMQAELSRVKSSSANASTSTAKVQELDQWMASVKSAPASSSDKEHIVRVRGGWGQADQARGNNGTLAGTDSAIGINGDPLVGVGKSTQDMYYYGAAFDYNVNNDLFGLWDGTSFQIEFGLEYGSFGNHQVSGLTYESGIAPAANTALTTRNGSSVNVNQIRINASPKIKFMHDSKLRPWLIPVGMDITVVSPPSGSVTVLGTGMNFGTGVDYDLFKGIVIGADARYHYSTSNVNGVNTDGLTLGGSVGFKF